MHSQPNVIWIHAQCLYTAETFRIYICLQIEDGVIQYRFDCGSGEGLARVDKMPVNDGYWHSIRLERVSRQVRIIIDKVYVAEGTAPGTNDVMNLNSNDVYFGAQVREDIT